MTLPLPPKGPMVFRDLPVQEEHRVLHPPGMSKSRPSSRELVHLDMAGEAGSTEMVPPSSFEEGREAGYAEGFRSGSVVGQESGRQKGFEQGLVEGRERGIQDGLKQTQEAREAMAKRIGRLDLLLRDLPAQINAQVAARIEAAEEDMVSLSYTVVCRLLGDKSLRRERVVNGVRQAIEQCCKMGSQTSLSSLLEIHVHPQDLELLASDEELSLWLSQQRSGLIPWVPDDQIELGGCVVRTTQGSLDARLETQFLALRHQIISAFQSETLPAGPGPFGEESK